MIELTLIVEAGESNGLMSLVISDKVGKVYQIKPLCEGKNQIEIAVETPNKLIFTLTGKNNRHDTLLDSKTGTIIKDKFIKITGVEIDGKPLNENRVAQMFTLRTQENREINSAFWGFNGCVEFDLPYADSLDLHLTNL
jgi:hypothetical protein